LAFVDLNNSLNLSTGRGEARDGPEAVKVTASGLQAAAIQLLRLNHSQNNRDQTIILAAHCTASGLLCLRREYFH
jgi:hypothetical protein